MSKETQPSTVGFLAIAPVEFKKVESKVEGGFARIAQKVELASSTLVMGFVEVLGNTPMLHPAGTEVLLKGDAGLSAWNKAVMEHNGVRFVKCPVSEVIAIKRDVRNEI